MTSREKILGLAVGAVAVVFVGYWGFGAYQGAKVKLDKELQSKKDELGKVRFDKLVAAKQEKQWLEYGQQTVSMDPNQIQTRLRDDLNRLADECGLTNTSVVIGNRLDMLGRRVRDEKSYARVLGSSLHAEGPIEGVLRFLFRLHARPYLVRIKTLALTPPSSRAAEGMLGVAVAMETPILPPTRKVAHLEPAKLDIAEPEEKPTTTQPSFDGYRKSIVRRKIFQPFQSVEVKAVNPNPANGAALIEVAATDLRWKPEPGVIGYKLYFGQNAANPAEMVGELSGSQAVLHREDLKVNSTYYWRVDTVHEDWVGDVVVTKGDVWNFRVQPKPQQVVVDTRPSGPTAPQPKVDIPLPDADFTVARMLSSPLGGQYVVLEDRRTPNNPNPPERKVEVGQPLYDGTLVYLHPRGVVSVKDQQWRFHPLGEPLKQGMRSLPDSRNQYGDVYDELVKLRDKWAGITQRSEDRPDAGG